MYRVYENKVLFFPGAAPVRGLSVLFVISQRSELFFKCYQ
jgi:hypothetical protein